ncbi:hypothetical protein GUJ93_ZPchr0004g39801 [Zizania palustris]|uniref:Uncharacterized protein n=1 Tax=Zizania palustris TaxID=103762 RepID=A0A8J5S2N7_ZIZPA|nr:hypothetical protein GUJ93_ZPchr0004g39801 [Zizania palustris]
METELSQDVPHKGGRFRPSFGKTMRNPVSLRSNLQSSREDMRAACWSSAAHLKHWLSMQVQNGSQPSRPGPALRHP